MTATHPGPTPSQTVGPFFGLALPFPGGGEVAPPGHPDTITLHGQVLDGAQEPVPDALLEFWQAAPDGSLAGAPGSMRRNAADGSAAGRNGVDFTGFARVATDADGHYTLRTLPPGAPTVPYLGVCVFARGLTRHLFTRVYFPGGGRDALLAGLPEERRTTLVARREDGAAAGVYRFDVRLQGSGETVFLAFE